MAAIYLIRHGQASFGKNSYDQLSATGSEQAKLLGDFWQSMPAPDKIYAGDMLRHRQTLAHFSLGYQGKEVPVTLETGFNEFNHVEMLSCYKPEWKNFTQMFASITLMPNANKVFQVEFTQALKRWTSGEHDHEYKESWQQFKNRCVDALHTVINTEIKIRKTAGNLDQAQHSQDICIFTSAGPISVIIQHILGLSDEKTLMINQQIRNTSVTKLLFSEQCLSIDFLNNFSHLTIAGTDWETFR